MNVVSARCRQRHRRRFAAVLGALILIVLLLSGPQSAVSSVPVGLVAKAKHCKSFSYKHKHAHTTYRFYDLRIRGARCKTIKRVVYGYFHDLGAPAGSVPTDGYNVFGWNVLILDRRVDGRRGKRHFWGAYR